MNQPGEDLGLEADLLGFLLGAGILQQFDGHVPPEQLVGRPVDGAHAALAELLVQGESLVERRAYADHLITPVNGLWSLVICGSNTSCAGKCTTTKTEGAAETSLDTSDLVPDSQSRGSFLAESFL